MPTGAEKILQAILEVMEAVYQELAMALVDLRMAPPHQVPEATSHNQEAMLKMDMVAIKH